MREAGGVVGREIKELLARGCPPILHYLLKMLVPYVLIISS